VTEHLCVIDQRRQYERAAVCNGCRTWLDRTLVEIVELYALLPANLLPGQAHGQRVSGSREAPLPLRVDPLDLMMPARAAEPTAAARAFPEDQMGDLSVASRLDSWVCDWRSSIRCGDIRPPPTVEELVRWLRVWLEEACDSHRAIDEFAEEMRELVHGLRVATGRNAVHPELKKGVPCRECERLALFRKPGSDFIECGSCGLLLTPEEYERWTALIASPDHQPWVRELVAAQRINEEAS